MKFTPSIRFILLACLALMALPSAASAQVVYGSGSYATDIPSSAPTLLAPVSGTTVAYPEDALAFSWSRVPGASNYQIQVAKQPSVDALCTAGGAFSTNFITVDAKSTDSAWIPTMTDAASGSEIWTGTYCWRTRSFSSKPGLWSSPAKFTRTWSAVPSSLRFYNDTDGAIPRTSGSSDFATGSLTTEGGGYLSWSPVVGAATYEVQVGTAQTFSDTSVILTRDGIRDSRVSLIHLPDNTYFWRVRAVAPNGTEGAWSGSAAQFTVNWKASNLVDPAKIYPTDNATVSDVRIGWTPVPGASYYQYQMGALPNGAGDCTWDPDVPGTVPDLYGSWVNIPALYDDSDRLVKTSPRTSAQCRLSPPNATTINNWVTLDSSWDQKVFANVANTCLDDEGKVQCARAELPENKAVDEPSIFKGTAMTAPGSEDSPAYTIVWRVRPVYTLTQDRESGWVVNGTHTVYGSWSATSNRSTQFNLDRSTAVAGAVSRCTPTCLEHTGSLMEAGSATGNSTSLQMPVLTWKTYAGATGYVVQLFRDPFFNTPAVTKIVPAERSLGYGWQQSWAPTSGYPDDIEGTGYWWRVVPCKSSLQIDGSLTSCAQMYSALAGGLPAPLGSYSDGAQAQTFTKHSKLKTDVVANFEGGTPLLRYTSTDVASGTDYPGWSRGLDGAAYYQIRLDRTQAMTSPITLTTTMPRIVPFKPGATAGTTTELDNGLWYYQVRAVDKNDLAGSWTSIDSFSKQAAAPGSVVSGGGRDLYSTGAVHISWEAVAGANQYDVQWSLNDDFTNPVTTASTAQTTFLIPSSEAGEFHWRVRAVVNGASGDWTYADVNGGGPVTITQGTEIQTAVSRFATPVGQTMQVFGKLLINGLPVSSKTVALQMKNTTCNAAGKYVMVKTATSGAAGEEGTFGYNIKPDRNRCFRWAYTDGAGATVYSAPMSVTARPTTSLKLNKTRMIRKQAMYYTIRSNRAVNGRVRFQYQIGRKWATAHTVNVRFMKARKQRVFISRAGTFNTRVVIDLMYMGPARARYTSYVNVYQRGPRVRVNDLWRVYR